MDKREAKKLAYRSAFYLLNSDHNNEFLADDSLSELDQARVGGAWIELLEFLALRGWPSKKASDQ